VIEEFTSQIAEIRGRNPAGKKNNRVMRIFLSDARRIIAEPTRKPLL
jgi:hypothetical protein